mgnify:CR=1 FL=1|tara:strand:- start:4027 stop:4956 length:930 start_codon:yes stop_codon:yes gene_type:complete
MSEVEDIVKCPECDSRNLDRDETHGEIVCQDCGLVLEDNIIDQGAEWRVFSPEQGDQRARTGAPMSQMMHDKGLSTDLDWQNKDYSGKAVSTKMRSQLYRMRKWQRRARVSNALERNLSVALAEIDRICSRLNLAKPTREEAATIYRKAMEKRLVRGRSIEGVSAASIYIACRLHNVPRTLDEIAQASRTGRKEIGRTARFVIRELKIRIQAPRPQEYVARFCSELGLPPHVEAKAMEFVDEICRLELDSGKGPVGIAASSIYIAGVLSKHHRTQREVSEAAGVTEVTIRNRYKEICRHLNLGDINADD